MVKKGGDEARECVSRRSSPPGSRKNNNQKDVKPIGCSSANPAVQLYNNILISAEIVNCLNKNK
jgi:hypothetical protein